jgi:hypothetical protein
MFSAAACDAITVAATPLSGTRARLPEREDELPLELQLGVVLGDIALALGDGTGHRYSCRPVRGGFSAEAVVTVGSRGLTLATWVVGRSLAPTVERALEELLWSALALRAEVLR